MWRSGNVKTRAKGDRKALSISFRAALLQPQNYILRVTDEGLENAELVAAAAGNYKFEVVAKRKAAVGRYEIKITELRGSAIDNNSGPREAVAHCEGGRNANREMKTHLARSRFSRKTSAKRLARRKRLTLALISIVGLAFAGLPTLRRAECSRKVSAQQGMMRRFVLALLSFLVLFAACDVGRYSDEDRFERIEKKLMASVNDLTKVPSNVQLTNEPYIRGKIAVFQTLEKRAAYETGVYLMQPSYFREMKDNYATTPEEVGTVALVNCKAVQKGVYKSDDGREYPAMVEDCDLMMIDRSKAAVVFKKSFEKTPTEDRRVTGNFVVTQSAQSDVLEFLKGLARR